MIGKVDAVVLFVNDLDLCMKFYRDIVGIEVVFSDATSFAFKMEGQDFALVSMASAVQMLNEEMLGLDKGVAHRFMLCADVADVDATYKTLTARGLSFLKPPVDQDWGFRAVYFTDPEGNIWELRQAIPAKQ